MSNGAETLAMQVGSTEQAMRSDPAYRQWLRDASAPPVVGPDASKLTQGEYHAQRAEATGSLALLLEDTGDEQAARLFRDASEAHGIARDAYDESDAWTAPVAEACEAADACEEAARTGDRLAVGALVEQARTSALSVLA